MRSQRQAYASIHSAELMELERKRASIPFGHRCICCGGSGKRKTGCSIKYPVYVNCWACDGSGKTGFLTSRR